MSGFTVISSRTSQWHDNLDESRLASDNAATLVAPHLCSVKIAGNPFGAKRVQSVSVVPVALFVNVASAANVRLDLYVSKKHNIFELLKPTRFVPD
jgi:hypothetical protein